MQSICTQISQRAYDGFIAASNGSGQTVENLASEFLENQGVAYANILEIGRITPAAFMRRFTVSEYTAIYGAAEIDLIVGGLVQVLVSRPFIELTDPALEQGLRIIAGRVDGVALERIPVLLHYDRPQPASIPEQP
jgi:hypothetical protein